MLDEFTLAEPLHLGDVRIAIDHELFVDAIGYGLLSYFESGEYENKQMSAQQLLRDFKQTLRDEDTPLCWRIGFIIGEFAGLLNPDLDKDDPSLTYLESLSRKCQRSYC